MTQAEADKIATIIATADGGCSVCVGSLCNQMTAAGFGFEFRTTGRTVEIPATWSDDPLDATPCPEVVALPAPKAEGEAA